MKIKLLNTKRLGVRLSLAFSSIVIITMLTLAVVSRLVINTGVPPESRPTFDESSEEFEKRFEIQQERGLRRLSQNLLTTAIVGGIVGVGAGIWISRSLTAPLNELVEAAHAIGSNDLSRRVKVQGSQEIIEVSEAFNQMATDLEQAERHRHILIADVSHELRTPLTVLQGNLRAILDDVYKMDKEEMARLYDQTRHLTRLVEDLHELSQADAQELQLNLQETNLLSHLQSVVSIFEPIAMERDVRLTTEIDGNLPPIQADILRITQVLHNLLSNALHHTPAGGTITLRAWRNGEEMSVSVKDTGEGIDLEHLPHVFKRFYRTDSSRTRETGGTGLGLAIVKAIIEAHDGRVTVESAGANQGSTFTIYLPC